MDLQSFWDKVKINRWHPMNYRQQNRRYEELITKIEESYGEEQVSRYMAFLCGRALVKTALKRTGNSDKWKELKERYPLNWDVE